MKWEYYFCFQIQQGGRYIGGLQIFPEQLLIHDEWYPVCEEVAAAYFSNSQSSV